MAAQNGFSSIEDDGLCIAGKKLFVSRLLIYEAVAVMKGSDSSYRVFYFT